MSAKKKVAVITGASKGLGLTLCQRLYQQGYAVVAIARNTAPLQGVETRWAQHTNTAGELLALAMDATDEAEVNSAIKQVVDYFGQLNVLINNVGGLPATGSFQDLNAQTWLDCFNLNVMSTVYFCRASYPHLAIANPARVVNMASITAVEPGVFNPHYSACKAAILNLSKHLAGLWANDNILINTISAGPFDSPSLHGVIRDKACAEQRDKALVEQEFIANLSAKIPLGRPGTIDEVAAMTLFLISEQSSWTTGTNICIDGGKHRAIL